MKKTNKKRKSEKRRIKQKLLKHQNLSKLLIRKAKRLKDGVTKDFTKHMELMQEGKIQDLTEKRMTIHNLEVVMKGIEILKEKMIAKERMVLEDEKNGEAKMPEIMKILEIMMKVQIEGEIETMIKTLIEEEIQTMMKRQIIEETEIMMR